MSQHLDPCAVGFIQAARAQGFSREAVRKILSDFYDPEPFSVSSTPPSINVDETLDAVWPEDTLIAAGKEEAGV